MPFISALGYNVFDPTGVTPELCADVGVKKGEKVDYAILREGKPIILFECKHHGADLGKVHASQLYRYFSVTEARFSVLTNGLVYWFYTDLEAPNKMDERLFFEFNMLDIKESAVEELKKFSKSIFDLDYILNSASELKYTREIKRLLVDQMQEPTDEFVQFFASRVYSGRMTQGVREQFAQLTKQAFKQLLNDQINERLKTALASDPTSTAPPAVEIPSLTGAGYDGYCPA
jgi:predicted type IV restriction endonuclease